MKTKNEQKEEIFTTTNYALFSLIKGNRTIEVQERPDLINAIEKTGVNIAPIIVTKNHEILDGQNRLEICKKFGFPVKYCYINSRNILTHTETILTLNTSAKVWDINDYLNAGMYSKDPVIVANYTELHRLCNHTVLKVNISTLLLLCGHNKDHIKAQKLIHIPEKIECLISIMNQFSKLYFQKVGKNFHVQIIAKTIFNIECDLYNQYESGNTDIYNIWDYDLMLSKILIKIPDIGFDHNPTVLKNYFKEAFNRGKHKNKICLS